MKPSDDIKKKYNIYMGGDAQTISEMCQETSLNDSTVRRMVKSFLDSGIWKEVRVKRGNMFCKAYIKVKGK